MSPQRATVLDWLRELLCGRATAPRAVVPPPPSGARPDMVESFRNPVPPEEAPPMPPTQPFLALITPLSQPPDVPPDKPPGIWGPTDPRPTHPIVIPPGSLAPGVPAHPIVLPPPIPAHPIVIPPGSVDPGPPLVPAHPIVLPPPIPAHPIVIPPDAIAPGIPAHPIFLPPVIWGPDDPRPSNPIYLPPPASSLAWYGVSASGQVWGPFYGPGSSGAAPGPPGNLPPAAQPIRK